MASQVMTIMMMRMTAWIEQEIVLYLATCRLINETLQGLSPLREAVIFYRNSLVTIAGLVFGERAPRGPVSCMRSQVHEGQH